ncbi:MAG TPA: hypothetical protein VF039_13715 [Longimicrobiales bacterium]
MHANADVVENDQQRWVDTLGQSLELSTARADCFANAVAGHCSEHAKLLIEKTSFLRVRIKLLDLNNEFPSRREAQQIIRPARASLRRLSNSVNGPSAGIA